MIVEEIKKEAAQRQQTMFEQRRERLFWFDGQTPKTNFFSELKLN